MAVLTALNIAEHLPATLTAPGLREEQFLELCSQFPDAMIEYSSDGTVTIMPPTDPETGKQNVWISHRLVDWANRQGEGSVTGPDASFRLPDGSRRSPDASWFNEARWQQARASGRRYPVFAPEFIIEMRSPQDKIRVLREKMAGYIDNGVQLAWLIDPIEKTVTIYRPGRDPEVLVNPASVAGEGPVEGFVLSLDRIL